MTILLVSAKNEMRLDKWNFNFSSIKIIFNSILGIQYMEFRWCTSYPIILFCFNQINFYTLFKTHFVEYNRAIFEIFQKTWKKIGSFFLNLWKSRFLQIKRSVGKWKISIKISFNVKHKTVFWIKNTLSSLLWSLFWELLPFKTEYC